MICAVHTRSPSCDLSFDLFVRGARIACKSAVLLLGRPKDCRPFHAASLNSWSRGLRR
jgi:hypothetical protein